MILVNSLYDMSAISAQSENIGRIALCFIVLHGASEDEDLMLVDLDTPTQGQQLELTHELFATNSELDVLPGVLKTVVTVDSFVQEFAVSLAPEFVDPAISEGAGTCVYAWGWHF